MSYCQPGSDIVSPAVVHLLPLLECTCSCLVLHVRHGHDLVLVHHGSLLVSQGQLILHVLNLTHQVINHNCKGTTTTTAGLENSIGRLCRSSIGSPKLVARRQVAATPGIRSSADGARTGSLSEAKYVEVCRKLHGVPLACDAQGECCGFTTYPTYHQVQCPPPKHTCSCMQ